MLSSAQEMKAPLLGPGSMRGIEVPLGDAEGEVTAYKRESMRFLSERDDGAGATPEEIPARVRRSMAYFDFYFRRMARPCRAVYFALYLVIAIIITLFEYDNDETHNGPYWKASIVCYSFWLATTLLLAPFLFGGTRLYSRWVGFTPIAISGILNGVTLILFLISFGAKFSWQGSTMEFDHTNYHWFLLLAMAVTVMYDTKSRKPLLDQLHWTTLGALSEDEISENTYEVKTPLAGVDTPHLRRVARNAGKAVGVSSEVAESIDGALRGRSIGRGSAAFDDWRHIMYRLSKEVSMSPFNKGRGGKMTPDQYRNLVRQMIIYLRAYNETGKASVDEADQKRTVPLSMGECISVMFKLAWQVPIQFILAIIPKTTNQVLLILGSSVATRMFVGGYIFDDRQQAMQGFVFLMAINALTPVLNFLANITETRFGTAMVDCCRRRMLAVMLRGGTAFDEVHRGGKLVDAFSSQIS